MLELSGPAYFLLGRCAVCGTACAAIHRGTEVCARCADVVRAFHAAQQRAISEFDEIGWALGPMEHDGSTRIVRLAERQVFPDDESACAYVVGCIAPPTSIGSPPCSSVSPPSEGMHPEEGLTS